MFSNKCSRCAGRHYRGARFLYGLLIGVLCVFALSSFSGSHRVAASTHPATLPLTTPQQSADPCADPLNPIVKENCLTGSADWIIRKPLDDIEGYAYPPSVNSGEALDLFINTSASQYNIDIYRSGYYGGLGGRLITSIPDVKGQKQPACHHDLNTGLTSCGNWDSSYHLSIPPEWVSGVYIAKLTRPDTGGESYALFVVRDDERHAPILFQQSLFTFHAYNNFGGKSLYTVNSTGCDTDTTTARAAKVSLLRPYSAEQIKLGGSFNHYPHVEYPFVYWLEQQGYDLSYTTNLDTHRAGLPGAANEILNHQVFVSAGHDEYWTYEMRDAVTAARDAGVNLIFFSSNVSYWRVRLETDPWNGLPDTVVANYKTTENGPNDPSGDLTSTFRDPERTNRPENSMIGIEYVGDNDQMFFPLRVTAEEAQDRVYRHTALQTMPAGTVIYISSEVLGWEWDAVVDNGVGPENLDILASSPVYGLRLLDAGNFEQGTSQHSVVNVTRYTASSGAVVYAFGTNQWGWSLGTREIEVRPADPLIQQITYNVFADLGVQPATPVDGIVLDGEDRLIPVDSSRFLPVDQLEAPTISSIHVNIPMGDILAQGRMVQLQWWTDTPSMGQVWLGEEEGHVIDPVWFDSDYTRFHSATLVNLRPNTTYYYKIVAVDQNWQITDTQEQQFHTAGNFPAQAARTLMLKMQAAQCWQQRHPQTARLGAGTVFIAVLVAAGAGLFRWRRANHHSTARSETPGTSNEET